MRYLRTYENLTHPKYTFKIDDVAEYFFDLINPKPDWTKMKEKTLDFLKDTTACYKIDIIDPEGTNSHYNVTPVDVTFHPQTSYQMIFQFEFGENFALVMPNYTINVYDDIPEESKKVLLEVDKKLTQRRFDL